MGSIKPIQQERDVHFQKGTKSDADTNPEPKSKPGWYYSELSERWCKTEDQLNKEALEISQSTTSDTTISTMKEVAIHVEVREVMQKKFAVGRATLGTNPSSHHEDSVKCGTAIPSIMVSI